MRNLVGRYWRQVCLIVLLTCLDLAVSLPVVGATCRPFSWMSVAPADAATVYPVIRDLSFSGGKVSLSAEIAPGGYVVLQRSTNLLDASAWDDVVTAEATSQMMQLIDTNPISRAVFYRVKQVLGEAP